jgi:hypothetical protein
MYDIRFLDAAPSPCYAHRCISIAGKACSPASIPAILAVIETMKQLMGDRNECLIMLLKGCLCMQITV